MSLGIGTFAVDAPRLRASCGRRSRRASPAGCRRPSRDCRRDPETWRCGLEEVIIALVTCATRACSWCLACMSAANSSRVARVRRAINSSALTLRPSIVLVPNSSGYFWKNIRADRCGRGLRHVNPPGLGAETTDYIRRGETASGVEADLQVGLAHEAGRSVRTCTTCAAG